MQRQQTWKNWPILLGGIFIIGLFLFLSHLAHDNKPLSSYFADIAGAMTAIIISISTYDEWERRRQRERYLPPERMGVTRIQEEVFQLLYQFAFVLTLRFDKNSQAMRTVSKATVSKAEFTKPETELKAKAAKHISQTDPAIKNNLFKLSKQALAKPKTNRQTYADLNQLILQTERVINQVDIAISTYGYSFTPEVHKWALDVREGLSQSITGKIVILSVRLAAVSKSNTQKVGSKITADFNEVINELIAVGKKSSRIKVED